MAKQKKPDSIKRQTYKTGYKGQGRTTVVSSSETYLYDSSNNRLNGNIEEILSSDMLISSCTAAYDHLYKYVDPYYYLTEAPVPVTYQNPLYAPNVAALTAEANNRVIDRILDLKANANLATAFAERREAIDMVSSRVEDLYKVLRKARRPLLLLEDALRRNPNSKRVQKNLASARLEYAYGWSPLMGDITSLVDLKVPPAEVKIRGFSSRYHSEQTGKIGPAQLYRSSDGTTQVTIVTKLRLANPIISSADSIGLINPALIAWELVPFSFVVDWVIPVGSFLEDMTALTGFEVIDCGRTVGYRGVSYANYSGASSSGTTRANWRGPYSLTSINLSRLMPENPFNLSRFLNAAALIRQLKR